jgi:hypothetical protein
MGTSRYIQMAIAVTAAIGTAMAAPAPTGTITATGTVNVTCVIGAPAVPFGGPNPHLWPITNFALVKPIGMPEKSYTLDKAWVDVHKLGHGGVSLSCLEEVCFLVANESSSMVVVSLALVP